MPSFKLFLHYFLLVVFASILGLSLWYIRHTSLVAEIIVDAIPLASDNGLTNIVILGVGGAGHEGGDLTDSVLVVSLRYKDGVVKLLSIPRDVWVSSAKIKLNAAYHYGGFPLVETSISQVIGVPIHYSALIDFAGFVKLIDIVGGIDIVVERAFDDYKYPIPGKETAEPETARYEHLHFDAGPIHLDGTTALKFARSRHAEGEEGTDFARSARQQLIIKALQDKIISSDTLFNLQTLTQILDNLNTSIKTNIERPLYRSFFNFGLHFVRNGRQLQSGSLTNYLVTPQNLTPYGGAWVLLPTDDIKSYVAKFLAE